MVGRAVVTKANRQARFEYGMKRVMLWAEFQTLGGRLNNEELVVMIGHIRKLQHG